MTSLFVLILAVQALPSEIALASAATNSSATSGDRLVCRQRPTTGTRLRFTRVCMTLREWNERREDLTRGMRDYTTREMTNQPPPPITPGSD